MSVTKTDIALNSISEGASYLTEAIQLVCDNREEREDLIRRLTSIAFQLTRITGTPIVISFEDHVAQTIKLVDGVRAVIANAEGGQP